MTRARLLWLEDAGEVPTERLATCLPAPERQELEQLRHPDRARGFVLSRLLLRRALCGFPGGPDGPLRFRRELSGRLVLADAAAPHISLSHAPGLVAVIVGNAPCGVDAERPRPVDALAVARRYFAPDEAAWLAGLAPAARSEAFLQLWTLKEASVKALGVGLAGHMAQLAFALDGDAPRACRESPALQVRLEATAHHVVAAVLATSATVEWETRGLQRLDE